MRRDQVKELHYITPIRNVPSIMEYGIISYNRAQKLKHRSVAMQEIQSRRVDKKVPGGLALHDYVNLYFDAHNPMLSRRRGQNDQICVLCVSPAVLDLPDVVISDHNAASGWARFLPSSVGMRAIDADLVYAEYWTHQNQFEEWDHKSRKYAEVLVPKRVGLEYILGAYIANTKALETFQELDLPLHAEIKTDMFF